MKFDRHFGSSAADGPVKFQNDTTIQSTNLAASRLYEILRKDVFSDIETGPRTRQYHIIISKYTCHMITRYASIWAGSTEHHTIISYCSNIHIAFIVNKSVMISIIHQSTWFTHQSLREHRVVTLEKLLLQAVRCQNKTCYDQTIEKAQVQCFNKPCDVPIFPLSPATHELLAQWTPEGLTQEPREYESHLALGSTLPLVSACSSRSFGVDATYIVGVPGTVNRGWLTTCTACPRHSWLYGLLELGGCNTVSLTDLCKSRQCSAGNKMNHCTTGNINYQVWP